MPVHPHGIKVRLDTGEVGRVQNVLEDYIIDFHAPADQLYCSELSVNLSDYLKEHIHYDYHYISNLFSEVEGTTIEKYFIAQEIERSRNF